MILVISSNSILSLDLKQAIEAVNRTPAFVCRSKDFDINTLDPKGIKAAIIDLPLDPHDMSNEMAWLSENHLPAIILSTGKGDGALYENVLPWLEHFEKPIIADEVLPALRRAVDWWTAMMDRRSRDLKQAAS